MINIDDLVPNFTANYKNGLSNKLTQSQNKSKFELMICSQHKSFQDNLNEKFNQIPLEIESGIEETSINKTDILRPSIYAGTTHSIIERYTQVSTKIVENEKIQNREYYNKNTTSYKENIREKYYIKNVEFYAEPTSEVSENRIVIENTITNVRIDVGEQSVEDSSVVLDDNIQIHLTNANNQVSISALSDSSFEIAKYFKYETKDPIKIPNYAVELKYQCHQSTKIQMLHDMHWYASNEMSYIEYSRKNQTGDVKYLYPFNQSSENDNLAKYEFFSITNVGYHPKNNFLYQAPESERVTNIVLKVRADGIGAKYVSKQHLTILSELSKKYFKFIEQQDRTHFSIRDYYSSAKDLAYLEVNILEFMIDSDKRSYSITINGIEKNFRR